MLISYCLKTKCNVGLTCSCEKGVWEPVSFIAKNFVVLEFQLNVTCLYSLCIYVLLKAEVSRSFESAL